jgi:hypothetical protein
MFVVMVVGVWLGIKEETQVVFNRGKIEAVVCLCRCVVNSSRCVI